MRVSAKELYGLRAMGEFARHFGQGPLSLAKVAGTQGISQAYLEQIAIDLRRAGLLQSQRGAQGGYFLARAPQSTTAGDVIRALEGSILPVQCVAEQRCTPCASENGCMTRGVWEEVRDRLVETLDSITLADLQLPRRDSAHEAADDSGDAEQQTGPTLATSAGPSPWRRIKE